MSKQPDFQKRINALAAEIEAEGKLVKVLRGLGKARGRNVLMAVHYLLLADECVPGLFNEVAKALDARLAA